MLSCTGTHSTIRRTVISLPLPTGVSSRHGPPPSHPHQGTNTASSLIVGQPFSATVLVHASRTEFKDAIPTGDKNTLAIHCASLIEPHHLFWRVAETMLRLDREDAAKLTSVSAFLGACRKYEASATTLVLHEAEALLREGPMVLWALLHLRTILVRSRRAPC